MESLNGLPVNRHRLRLKRINGVTRTVVGKEEEFPHISTATNNTAHNIYYYVQDNILSCI
jgi:hypothetical protein